MFESFTCVFMVVPDALIGIECTEHSAFDLIFVSQDLKQDLSAYAFLRSLRAVGATTPIVLLISESASSESKQTVILSGGRTPKVKQLLDQDSNANTGLPAVGYHAPPSQEKFTAALHMPYTKRDLCEVIRSAIFLPRLPPPLFVPSSLLLSSTLATSSSPTSTSAAMKSIPTTSSHARSSGFMIIDDSTYGAEKHARHSISSSIGAGGTIHMSSEQDDGEHMTGNTANIIPIRSLTPCTEFGVRCSL